MFIPDNSIVTDLLIMKVDFKKTKESTVPGREFHSLSLRLSGSAQFFTDGDTLTSRKGDITYIPAGLTYRTSVPEEGSILVCHFTLAGEVNASPEVLTPSPYSALPDLFASLHNLASSAPDFKTLSLFYSVLAEAGNLSEKRNGTPEPVRRAKDLLDAEIGNPLFSVESLPNDLGISGTWLRKSFRKAYGVSPLMYLREQRIGRARLLLRSGYYTVGETAGRCGYRDTAYFCAEFRRFTGITPGAYRKTGNK